MFRCDAAGRWSPSRMESTVLLGSETTAHIRTGSLLGKRVLTLESAGTATMRPHTVIPVSRTSSPYSLTDAVNDLTTNVAGTDTESLNQSLATLSQTIDQIAPQLGPTFDGLTRSAQSLNGRNRNLDDLLKSAADVSGILSQRSQQVNRLILNANDLLEVLNDRREVIAELLANISAVSRQLSGLVHDNERELTPALQKLNSVTAMLKKERDAIGKTLPGLAKYELTQGEVVSSGADYNALVANLDMPELLQPFLDYAFGFRRGVNSGQPRIRLGRELSSRSRTTVFPSQGTTRDVPQAVCGRACARLGSAAHRRHSGSYPPNLLAAEHDHRLLLHCHRNIPG